jgi:hypothetical protein
LRSRILLPDSARGEFRIMTCLSLIGFAVLIAVSLTILALVCLVALAVHYLILMGVVCLVIIGLSAISVKRSTKGTQ